MWSQDHVKIMDLLGKGWTGRELNRVNVIANDATILHRGYSLSFKLFLKLSIAPLLFHKMA